MTKPNPEPSEPALSVMSSVDAANPWPGLATFTEDQTAFFFGRDEEMRELLRRVERKALTVLFGQSGLGKSSLLQAGVFPRLRGSHFCPVYVRLDHSPDAPPLTEQIKSIVFRGTAHAGAWTKSGSAVKGETLWEFFHHREDQLLDPEGKVVTPVLVFDQFEELFTLGGAADPETRRRAGGFIAELADLVENRTPAVLEARMEQMAEAGDPFDFARADYRVLIALREDYLPHLESLKAAMPSLMQNRMRLTRMQAARALEAVVKPGAGLVTEEVARQIVGFVAGHTELAGAEVEPSLLNLVCRELNNQRRVRGEAVISASLLAGTRDTILREFYERTMADQPVAVRHFIENELLTESGYRENIALERAQKLLTAAGPAAIDTLVNRRLLRIEERLDVRRVELTHDVLCSVVKASRDLRLEREAKLAEEKRRRAVEQALRDAETKTEAARRSLLRARLMLGACAGLVVIAGYFAWSSERALDRALAAEQATRRAGLLTDSARSQAQDLLGYVVTDLDEQLSDMGQLPLLRQINERAVAYYDGLPEELRTPATGAAQARALANLGGVKSAQGESADGGKQIERAIQLFENLQKQKEMSEAMRLDYAYTLRQFAWHLARSTRFSEGVKICAQAEEILAPILSDEHLAVPARRELAEILDRKGFSYMRSGQAPAAVKAYEQSMARSLEADQLAPSAHNGLRVARTLPWYGQALGENHQRKEEMAAYAQGQAKLREFLAREPNLLEVKRQLANATNFTVNRLSGQWRWDEARTAAREARQLYNELLAVDPENKALLNNLLTTYGGEFFRNYSEGRFSEAEEISRETQDIAAQRGMAENRFLQNTMAFGLAFTAQLKADMGNGPQAREVMGRARTVFLQGISGLNKDSSDYAFAEVGWIDQEANLEAAGLNWPEARRREEAALARLHQMKIGPADQENMRGSEESIQRGLAFIALIQGDYASARRAQAQVMASCLPLSDAPGWFELRNFIGDQVRYAFLLAKTGDEGRSREMIDAIWPEAEKFVAAGGEHLVARVAMAEWLWQKAGALPGSPATERQALLERAAGYLRPAAAERRLTRYEKEVLLATIEQELSRI